MFVTVLNGQHLACVWKGVSAGEFGRGCVGSCVELTDERVALIFEQCALVSLSVEAMLFSLFFFFVLKQLEGSARMYRLYDSRHTEVTSYRGDFRASGISSV